jgi:hypothetical protein
MGPAPPEGRSSWPASGCGCLMSGCCLSQQGRVPVVPHGPGAWQGLMGRGSPRGGGLVIPQVAGSQAGPEGWWLGGLSHWAVGLAPDGWWWGSPWSWIWYAPRGRDPAICGSGAGLWPGTAWGAESWQKGAVALQAYRAAVLLLDHGMEKTSMI